MQRRKIFNYLIIFTTEELSEKLAEAAKTAALLKGQGDAVATKTYANAYNKNKKLYSFLRSLEAYKNSFSNSGNMMVLDPKSEFFKHFNNK